MENKSIVKNKIRKVGTSVGVLFDRLLSVFRRGDPLFFLKNLGEVAGVLVSDFEADLQHAQLPLNEQFFRDRNPDGGEVVEEGDSHLFPEQMAEIVGIDSDGQGRFF